MDDKQKMILRAIFFFGAAVVFTTIFLTTIVAGILKQMSGVSIDAVPFYLLAAISFYGAFWMFTRGKKRLRASGYTE